MTCQLLCSIATYPRHIETHVLTFKVQSEISTGTYITFIFETMAIAERNTCIMGEDAVGALITIVIVRHKPRSIAQKLAALIVTTSLAYPIGRRNIPVF